MSKSKGNVVNPLDMIDKYGVDALRFWMYSVNQPGDSKNFDEKTVDEVVKKVFNLLLNVVSFYELYSESRRGNSRPKSKNVLDKWILLYLDDLVLKITNSLDSYDVFTPARLIRDFIADLSQWYVRRSRDRFKGDDEEDRMDAADTLGFVLERLSIVMAPFMPFLAEHLYQKLRNKNDKESVHLLTWPEVDTRKVGDVLPLSLMNEVRRVVSVGLEARSKSGIKVRQPLLSLTIKSEILLGANEYVDLIKDEVNVKNISFDKSISEEVLLNTEITEELKKEGDARELIRSIQEKRKEKGLSPKDIISINISLTDWCKDVVAVFREEIIKTCGISELNILDLKEGEELWFSVEI
jgi:isoleucyl-tRNA synthetase